MISTPGKVLFIDTVHSSLWEGLTKLGFNCIDGTALNREQILIQLPDYQGVVLRSRIKIDAEFFQKGSGLVFVARSGSGMENIDLDAANKQGVHCISSPEGNADAVAEHCLGMLLAISNKLKLAGQNIKKGIWDREKNRGRELNSMTIGIVGFGVVGKTLARLCSALGMKVLAFDVKEEVPYPTHVQKTSLDDIQKECDVISFHVDQPTRNAGLVNGNFFDRCAKKPIIINTSRGQILSLEAAIKALNSETISGLALDVFEFEKRDFSVESARGMMRELARHPMVIVSPHVAGWTIESYKKLSLVLLEKIETLVSSK